MAYYNDDEEEEKNYQGDDDDELDYGDSEDNAEEENSGDEGEGAEEGSGEPDVSDDTQNVLDKIAKQKEQAEKGKSQDDGTGKGGKEDNAKDGQGGTDGKSSKDEPGGKSDGDKTKEKGDQNGSDGQKGDPAGKKSELPKKPEGGPNPTQDVAKKAGDEASKKAAQEATKKASQETIKKVSEKATEMAAKKVAANAAINQLLAALAPILFWVVVIILIIIIVIGVLGFILLAPGQAIAKLKQMGTEFLNKMQAFIVGEQNIVSGEDIANVAEYIESMGYDLKGEGFVTKDKTTADIPASSDGIDRSNWKVENGIVRDENDNVVSIDSDPIRTYLVSDNQCYLVKNFNTNLDSATGGHGALVAMAGAALAVVLGFIFSPLIAIVAIAGAVVLFASSGNPNWGAGLISIYHEGGDIGVRGSPYAERERGYIELDPASKKLTVKRGWTNNAVTFDIDGWSGRYGMPLEFLLSVHIATQMPDLAMAMATSFDTDVEVLLHGVEDGSVTPGIQTADGSKLSWTVIQPILTEDNNVFEDIWNGILDLGDNNWFSLWTESKHEAYSFTDNAYKNLFDKGFPHAAGCSCCTHIHGGAGRTDGEECGDSDDASDHYICDACKGFVQSAVSAMRLVADTTWNSYTPYISRVRNHWFRDVYFVMSNDELNSLGVVQTDEQYFYETNERWTIYETYEDGDTIPEGFEVGDYKLYTYDPNRNPQYVESTYTKEEVDEINEKIANGDTSVTRVVKKPATVLLTELGENVINPKSFTGNGWRAYDTIASGGGESENWIKLEMGPDAPEELKNDDVLQYIYYTEDRPNDIQQIEDGQRTETNSLIKDMFINKSYYKYDGTTERANAIAEDKAKISNADGTVDTSKFDTADDPRNEELISKVSLAKDSLTAFSMLENTHTLDADYIYRDFKELVVELDYFDKEDLSDKIQTVMQWPIPDCGSGGWPIRKYEKGDTFYGTLINSMVDLELMTEADVEAAEKLLGELENEVEPDNTDPVPTSPTGNVPTGSVEDLVKKGYEVHKIMETTGQNGGWDYCIYNDKTNTKHHAYGHDCGLDSTIQEAMTGNNNTCCATFVSWVLKEAGFDLSNHPNMHGAKSTYEWCKLEGWTQITDYAELEPGDLLFNKGGNEGTGIENIGHVQLLGDNGEWLNAGSVSAINDPPKTYTADFIIGMRSQMKNVVEPFKGYKPNQSVVSPLTGKVLEHGEVERQNEETGEMETVEFIKIEAINKYIYDTASNGTGYLACSGTDDTFKDKVTDDARKNLEGYDYFYQEYQGVLDGFVLYIEGFDLTLYDGDGAIALVNGGDKSSSDVTRYVPNEVKNMADDLAEARADWMEAAKQAAIPLIEIDGELYIKEGTVIGKTYEDPDMSGVEITSSLDAQGQEYDVCKGNGNYIRLILRNLEDSIVEDVESYLPIEDTRKSTPVEFEQLAYFLGCLEEGFYPDMDLGDAYGFEVLKDNAGNTTAFGLTAAVGDTVKDVWPDFVAHLQAGKVPKEEAQDVFILVLEAAKEEIEQKANGTLDENYLFALIDLHHASPACCYDVIDIYNANGTLTVEDFENHWGSNMNYGALLQRRGHNRGILATEGRFLLYQEGSEGDEVTFQTETPWTEFCDGGGTHELTTESSGFYTVEKGVDHYTPTV